MTKITAAITAVGGYVPQFVMTNKMLEEMVDTNDEWITTRTGIKERRVLKKEEGEGTSYLAIKAAQDLMEKKGLDAAEIDLVIVATATPDSMVASTAAFVASEIGAVNAFAYDLLAACSSFLFGMSTVAGHIETGRYKKVLLIGVSYKEDTDDTRYSPAEKVFKFFKQNKCKISFYDPIVNYWGLMNNHSINKKKLKNFDIYVYLIKHKSFEKLKISHKKNSLILDLNHVLDKKKKLEISKNKNHESYFIGWS